MRVPLLAEPPFPQCREHAAGGLGVPSCPARVRAPQPPHVAPHTPPLGSGAGADVSPRPWNRTRLFVFKFECREGRSCKHGLLCSVPGAGEPPQLNLEFRGKMLEARPSSSPPFPPVRLPLTPSFARKLRKVPASQAALRPGGGRSEGPGGPDAHSRASPRPRELRPQGPGEGRPGPHPSSYPTCAKPGGAVRPSGAGLRDPGPGHRLCLRTVCRGLRRVGSGSPARGPSPAGVFTAGFCRASRSPPGRSADARRPAPREGRADFSHGRDGPGEGGPGAPSLGWGSPPVRGGQSSAASAAERERGRHVVARSPGLPRCAAPGRRPSPSGSVCEGAR